MCQRIKQITGALCLAAASMAAHAQSFVDVPSRDPYSDTQAKATTAAILDSASGIALLGVNTAAPVLLGPLGFALGAGSKLITVATLGDRPIKEQKEMLDKSSAWWVGSATMNLLILASAAQPLALIGGITAGLMTWSGSSDSAPPALAHEATGLVAPNIPAQSSAPLVQDWAVGAEALSLKQTPPPIRYVDNPRPRVAPVPAVPIGRALEM